MHGTSRQALTRLRVRAWPILQTAVAAVGSWYLAKLLLPEEFEGYPLRKEFALLTREAKPWPGAKEPGE